MGRDSPPAGTALLSWAIGEDKIKPYEETEVQDQPFFRVDDCRLSTPGGFTLANVAEAFQGMNRALAQVITVDI